MDRPIGSLGRANRVLHMLSRINRASVRADSPDTLYREACRIAVECGMFKFAWIGLVDAVSGGLRLMTGYGDPSGPEESLVATGGLADTVRASDRPCIFNDLTALPQHLGCDELLRRGFRAMAGLPLCEGNRTIGIFVLYTDDTECFDETVIGLLNEVVGDVAFSLAHMLDEQRRLAAESKLYYLAFYDAQTGLPNRALLDDRLPQFARRGGLTLFDIRLQRLDEAVQIYGRLLTDEVLRLIAARLENFRSNDSLVAHLAQDEFALAVPRLTDAAAVADIARQLQQMLQAPVRVRGAEVFLHPSIGAAGYPQHEADIAHLLRRARVAARRDNGEAGFRIYSSELDSGLEMRMQMEADLHRALKRDEFQLHYQPQLNLKSGAIVGVEALLQWRHPQRGLVTPSEFVPVLEDCGLMPAAGAWVLRAACRQARAWQQQGLSPLRMGVNVSALQFKLADLVSTVSTTLRETGLDPRHLELELTEGLILENVEQTIDAMHQLKALGVALSLDDFGTGYSSLGYLRRYPVDRIKIDRSFIVDMTVHAGSAALVRSILAMATNLGLKTIAEGVETMEQFDYLRKQRCDEMQGFFFSRAVAPGQIARMCTEGRGLLPMLRATSGKRTVLLVESDRQALDSRQRILRRDSWNTIAASSAGEALALMTRHEVGVVVANAALPDMSTADFFHKVRGMYPDTVHILLAQRGDFDVMVETLNRAGLFQALIKPLDARHLSRVVDEAFSLFGELSKTRQSNHTNENALWIASQ